ncbi:Regulatory protein RecX [Moorella thermoacetica]|uniref:Regulatory protein RecX n=1 Tax=Neomoorella thermoacetica TaxID=1525 RepID=A0AAC9MUR6_NEOTH|nr:regulatory protein RecX [Moorella thermoacetica]AOQ23761.1 Regulatory protein RecX [Moorella thermoacetica]TYL13946.1 Regulatory protein RecX [Moorella thermoacetica]
MPLRGKTESTPAVAWEYALKLLTYRPRSEGEMMRRLQARGFASRIVTATINKLKEVGLLDDERFARDLATYRLATRPVGRIRLQQELQQHGVTPQLAAATVKDLLTPETEMAAARKLAQKYRRRPGEDDRRFSRRLARFLWQRGYDGEIIRGVLAEIHTRDNIDRHR